MKMKAKDLEAGRDWRQKLRVPHKQSGEENAGLVAIILSCSAGAVAAGLGDFAYLASPLTSLPCAPELYQNTWWTAKR